MKFALITIAILSFNPSFALNKGIYGVDNRKEIYEVSDPKIREMARAVATQVNVRNIRLEGNRGQLTYNRTVGEEYSLCSDEKFESQINPGECSGFLVGKDLLLTAGHCVRDHSECRSFKWPFVFSYKKSMDEDLVNFNRKDLYACDEIVDSEYGEWTRKDYALIRLKRVVKDRAPLKYRTTGKIKRGQPVFAIGHPMGLPAKYTDSGVVGNNGRTLSFFTYLDMFVVNSGTPVFNMSTYEVEGILIKGGRDIKFSSNGNCNRYFHEGLNASKEEVFRVTKVPYFFGEV